MTQGARPLCVPIALTASHEGARIGHRDRPFAVEPVWSHCHDTGQASQNGTTLRAASAGLSTVGQPAEARWPYNPALGHETQQRPASAAAADFHTATADIRALANDGIEQELEDTLASGAVTALVLELTAEFDRPGAGGEIAVPDLAAPPGGYHAVAVVGASTRPRGPRRLLILNSWGPGWGLGGYAWLPLDYLIAFGAEWAMIDPATVATIPAAQAS
jgi:C1A family cysteine protease